MRLKTTKKLRVPDIYIDKSGMEASLIELIRLRTSQINGCEYSPDLQVENTFQLVESLKRSRNLNSWRQNKKFSNREKAALGWTEAIILIEQNEISDFLYEEVCRYFNKQELITLTNAINAFNSYNKLSISFRTPEWQSLEFINPVQ